MKMKMIFKRSKDKNINKKSGKSHFYVAFTLAEVLITLGVIGIVAAMTIPTLNKQVQEIEYKTAYKKAYSDISQAFAQAIQEQTLTSRAGVSDAIATTSEWDIIKNALKIQKKCSAAEIYDCWADGDTVNGASDPRPGLTKSMSFIDASGRSWAQYSDTENIYLVDANGFKNPNRFGKDRWIFTLKNTYNTRITLGLPSKVGVFPPWGTSGGADVTVVTDWCHYPPCYYKSWLFN